MDLLNSIKMSDDSKSRLLEIIEQMNRENKEFYDCLTYDEEEVLNERGLATALYLLTDDDTITETGNYENAYIPYHLAENGNNHELKEYLKDLPIECRIRTTYYRLNIPNGILIDEIYSQSEWELEGAEVLYCLFDFKESYGDAEELARQLNLGAYYYHNDIQIHYVINFDDIENAINNDEKLYNKKNEIVELITACVDYDETRFIEFRNNILSEAV